MTRHAGVRARGAGCNITLTSPEINNVASQGGVSRIGSSTRPFASPTPRGRVRQRARRVRQRAPFLSDGHRPEHRVAEDAGADARKRISADNWQAVPEFRFKPAPASDLLRASLPGLLLLLVWLAIAALALIPIARHVQKVRR